MNRLYYQQVQLQNMIEDNRAQVLPGLLQKAKMEGFEDFKIVDYRTDDLNTSLVLIQFERDKKYGLCIWHNTKGEFIQEPGGLEMYQVTLEGLSKKYGFRVS